MTSTNTPASITVQLSAAQTPGKLSLDISNPGAETIGGSSQPVVIHLILPTKFLSDKVTANKDLSNQRLDRPGGPLTLSGGDGSWQARTHPDSSNKESMRLDLTNGALEAGQALAVTMDLAAAISADTIPVIYALLPVTTFRNREIESRDSLYSSSANIPVASGAGTAAAQEPQVDFWITKSLPFVKKPAADLTLGLGDTVTLQWEIDEKAVGAKLKGPFSTKNHEIELKKTANYSQSTYNISKDKITVRVTGSQVYLLEVNFPNLRDVTRMVYLDVYTGAELGSLNLVPQKGLPFSQVTASWAAWGVDEATLHINYPDAKVSDPNADPLTPLLGEVNLPLALDNQGDPALRGQNGTHPFCLPASGAITVALELVQDGTSIPGPRDDSIEIEQWDPWPLTFQDEQGKAFSLNDPPDALLYHAGRLILCAKGQLFVSAVALDADPVPNPTPFAQTLQDASLTWLTICLHKDQLWALRQRNSGDIELTGLTLTDKVLRAAGSPQPLPAAYSGWSAVQLASLGDRLYVIPKPQGPYNTVPYPVSWQPGGDSAPMIEPRLLAACQGQIAVLDDALYALHLDAGELLMFTAQDGQDGGSLAPPRLAAAGKTKPQEVKAGVLVAVQGVLLILGDEHSRAQIPIGSEKKWVHQDWVYDPHNDEWVNAGHGLDIAQGTAVYRHGKSGQTELPRRLFVIGGSGSTFAGNTLAVPAPSVHLFANNHYPDNKRVSLTSPESNYLDQEFTLDFQGPDLQSIGLPGPLVVTRAPKNKMRVQYSAKNPHEGVIYLPAGGSRISRWYSLGRAADQSQLNVSDFYPAPEITTFACVGKVPSQTILEFSTVTVQWSLVYAASLTLTLERMDNTGNTSVAEKTIQNPNRDPILNWSGTNQVTLPAFPGARLTLTAFSFGASPKTTLQTITFTDIQPKQTVEMKMATLDADKTDHKFTFDFQNEVEDYLVGLCGIYVKYSGEKVYHQVRRFEVSLNHYKQGKQVTGQLEVVLRDRKVRGIDYAIGLSCLAITNPRPGKSWELDITLQPSPVPNERLGTAPDSYRPPDPRQIKVLSGFCMDFSQKDTDGGSDNEIKKLAAGVSGGIYAIMEDKKGNGAYRSKLDYFIINNGETDLLQVKSFTYADSESKVIFDTEIDAYQTACFLTDFSFTYNDDDYDVSVLQAGINPNDWKPQKDETTTEFKVNHAAVEMQDNTGTRKAANKARWIVIAPKKLEGKAGIAD